MYTIEQLDAEARDLRGHVKRIESEAGSKRNHPNYAALYRALDRTESEIRAVRAIPSSQTETRSQRTRMKSIETLKRDMSEALTDMRSIWNESGGRLGTRFNEYQECEERLETAAGTIATRTGEPFGPRVTEDMSREERLNAWEREMSRGVTPGAGLQEQRRERRGNGGEGGPFRSFGEQLQAVVRAGKPGTAPDSRLFEVRAVSGLSEGIGADGGFMLQPTFSYSLLEAGMNAATIAPRCNKFPIGANSNYIELPKVNETSRANGSRWGGIQLYWAGEGDQRTASKPKFEMLTLRPHKLSGLVYLTEELIADVTVLENFVRKAFTEEFAFVIDDAIIRANGVGKPLGILESDATVTVAKEAGQTAATVVPQNLAKMLARLPAKSVPNSVFYYNQDVLPSLLTMTITSGTSVVPVFLPGGTLANRPYNTILGQPAFPLEQCETLGTEGDIILGDFSKYLLSTRGDLQIASSIHVRFLFDEMVMKFTWRVDGQPENSVAKTPARGSNTQSPFVTLATRS